MRNISPGDIIAVLTFLGGALMWYRGAVEKSYAAKRDFGHLKNNLATMNANLDTLLTDVDQKFEENHKEVCNKFDALHRELLDVKGQFYAVLYAQRDKNQGN